MRQIFSNVQAIDQKKLIDVVESFSALGIALPSDFVDFMSVNNGSTPALKMFDTMSDPINTYGMTEFYRLEDLMDIYKEWGKIIGYDWLPISEDRGGNQIVIGIKNSSINFCIWDEGEYPILRKIAPSFKEFVDKLYHDDSFFI